MNFELNVLHNSDIRVECTQSFARNGLHWRYLHSSVTYGVLVLSV